jgi:hypothetical protein
LRLAIAAYKLRDFKKVKTAANLGIALDPSEGEKKLLNEYVEKRKDQKEMRLDRNILEQQIRCSLRYLPLFFEYHPFTNLNILQYAVVDGDVTLMEEVVALGAVLDFPVSDKNASEMPPLPAPPGSTALLLACAMLAMYIVMERRNPNLRRNTPAGVLDTLET